MCIWIYRYNYPSVTPTREGGEEGSGWAGHWLPTGWDQVHCTRITHTHGEHSSRQPACSIYIFMYPPCALWTHTVSLQICPTLPPATAPIISSPYSSKILLFTPWYNLEKKK